MICANCRGTIHIGKPCEDCGIEYKTMINSIRHPEMKRLFNIIVQEFSGFFKPGLYCIFKGGHEF